MKTQTSLLQDYGKQKLLGYADSLRELADSFQMTKAQEAEDTKTQETDSLEGAQRQQILRNQVVAEQRTVFAKQIQEIAALMADIAQESCRMEAVSEKKYRQIQRELKAQGMQTGEMFYLYTEDGRRDYSISLKAVRNQGITVDDTAGFLSVVLNTRLIAARNSPIFVGNDWETYIFRQEPMYHILTGSAKATKQSEEISGDSSDFFEYSDGKEAMVLSDGMGSGQKALYVSSLVVNLIQRLLDAGFSMEASMQMVNASLLNGSDEQSTATLDLASIDLYQGLCVFVKVGAAPAFIKRDHMVEQISSRNLPLGLVEYPEVEKESRVLSDGDYVILLSDGILDALNEGVGESMLPEIIGKFNTQNPGELANDILTYVLHQCGGKIRDDMTILVTGIWECNLT